VTGNSASSPFYRSYDGLTTGNTLKTAPAILTGFRLDQYEVTVGRFRQFVNAMVASAPQPQPGQGKHAYLTGGGLAAVGGDAGAGSIEPGYPSGQPMPTVQSTWTGNLACFQGTWTDSAANNENLPITCLTWYEAYAFCIWDGGFLPSEAEWDYAAQGGPGSAPGAQRVYPWANNVGPLNDAGMQLTAPNNIDCTFANFTPSGSSACVGSASAVGSYSPSGDGKWGQADLAGNVSEWTLDSTAGTPSAYLGNPGASGNVCTDCANTSSALTNRIARGGSFNIAQSALYSSYRLSYPPTSRDGTVGVRCARAP
jgi:formylglycine-generating enzyme required for sulfatase activity